MTKVYNSIKQFTNVKNRKFELREGTNTLLVQEKLDGANFMIGVVNGEFQIRSRTRNITNDTEFQKVDMDSVRAMEPKLMELYADITKDLTNVTTLFIIGELLGSGRTKMNKGIAKGSKFEDIFVGFELWLGTGDKTLEERITKETNDRDFKIAGFDFLKSTLKELGLKVVPTELVKVSNMNEAEELFNKLLKRANTSNSLYDPESNIEGFVVKFRETKSVVKIVADNYKEISKSHTTSQVQKPTLDKVLFESMVNINTIEKYIQRMKEQQILPEEITKRDFGKVASNSKDLVDDWVKENIDLVIESMYEAMKGRINKEIVKNLLNK